MTLRRSHGTAAHRVARPLVVENLPSDEQPNGIARPKAAHSGSGRTAKGRFKADLARELGRAGGEAKRGWRAAADAAHLGPLAAAPGWASYASAASSMYDASLADVRRDVGGGAVGAGIRALLRLYSLQVVAARWASEQGAARVDSDPKLAASLFQQSNRWTESARSTLLTIHDLAVRQAPKRPVGGSVAALNERLARGAKPQ